MEIQINSKISLNEKSYKRITDLFFEIVDKYELSISEIKAITEQLLMFMENEAIYPCKRRYSLQERDDVISNLPY